MKSRARKPRPVRRAASARKPGGSAPAGAAIRLLLVDDHPVVREGLRSCLGAHPGLVVVGEAGSGEAALPLAARLRPDLVLMDINLPGINGLETAVRLRAVAPAAKVLILSVHENREYAAEVARCGARGYVLKDASPAELVQAIEAVHRGGAFFSPKVAASLLRTVGAPPSRSGADPARLTGRERDVLALIVTGIGNKAISKRLGVSLSTVKTLRGRLIRKLDLHSVAELTQFALAHGITVAPDGNPAARQG